MFKLINDIKTLNKSKKTYKVLLKTKEQAISDLKTGIQPNVLENLYKSKQIKKKDYLEIKDSIEGLNLIATQNDETLIILRNEIKERKKKILIKISFLVLALLILMLTVYLIMVLNNNIQKKRCIEKETEELYEKLSNNCNINGTTYENIIYGEKGTCDINYEQLTVIIKEYKNRVQNCLN